MLILRWGYVPNEVRAALRPLILQHLCLVPGWCRSLLVRYQVAHDEPDCGTVEACTWVDDEYRGAAICFYGNWLDQNPTVRRLDVIHELLHIALQPMAGEQSRTISRMFVDGESPKLHETLKDNWRRAVEGVTQDLAYTILQIPPDRLPCILFTEEEDEHPTLKAAS